MLTPLDLAPLKQASLIESQESLPPCVIGSAVVGSEIERTFGFLDGPHLLDPPLKNTQVITNPDWRERSSPALIASVYPLHARAAKISGHVQIKCTVSAMGAAENCQVISENPAGEQFGTAALRASQAFRFRPRTRNCVPEGGAVIVVPLDFVWRP